MQYKMPISAHSSRPWRIHAIASDFSVEDVWAMPTPGGPDDFSKLVSALELGNGAPEGGQGPVGRFLFALRWKLGKWFGWDEKGPPSNDMSISLKERLPTDLKNTNVPIGKNSPFTPLYLTENEYAAELVNSTMHGVIHLGWVEDGSGGYRGQMAVLVKPNGLLGKFYMLLIKPFRYLFIYPALMRSFEKKWQLAHKNIVE